MRGRALPLALELGIAQPDDVAILAGAVPDLDAAYTAAVPIDDATGEAAGAGDAACDRTVPGSQWPSG